MNARPLRMILPALLALTVHPMSILAAPSLDVAPATASGIYEHAASVSWTVKAADVAPGTAASYEVLKYGEDKIASGMLHLDDMAHVSLPASIDDTPATYLLRVEVAQPGGPPLVGYGGAAVHPSGIRPLEPPPADFDAFWQDKLRRQRQLPFNAKVTELDSGRPDVALYSVTLDTLDGSTTHLQMARPRKGDKFPALAIFQWAGVYPLTPDTVVSRAAQGWLAVNVMPHDLPLYEPKAYYDALLEGQLKEYGTLGNDDRDHAYLLGILLRATRAVEYLKSQPAWDGHTLVATGTSMGGYQAICVTGLDPDITAVAANVPAGCELSAPLGGRRAPWPYWILRNVDAHNKKAIHRAGRYFDAVNFARHIRVPALVSMGLIDNSVPPSGVYAMASQIKGPVDLVVMPLAPHHDPHKAFAEKLEALLKEQLRTTGQ